MKPELYQQCFELLEKYGAIRKDLSFGCEVFGYPNKGKNGPYRIRLDDSIVSEYPCEEQDYIHTRNKEKDEVIGHPPILSDCIRALINKGVPIDDQNEFTDYWFALDDKNIVYLRQHEELVGKKLISLLS